MEESEKRPFKDLVNALASNYRLQVSPPLYQALWMGLEDLPFDKVRSAFGKALRTCEFMPTAAKLRELAGRGPKQPQYFAPVDDELERIETCTFHKANPAALGPHHVTWCRKCRRQRIVASGEGKPQSIGEVLQARGLAPLDPEEDPK